MQPNYYAIPRDWPGKTAFLICGGPSVTQADVDKLKGRKVVVLNSSYQICPWADAVVFTDLRWWDEHKDREAFRNFQGEKISLVLGNDDPSVRIVSRKSPPLSIAPTCLAVGHSSVPTGINYLALKGCCRVGILGLDGKDSPDGKTHHHEPHPWDRVEGCYEAHGGELRGMVEQIHAMGVLPVNVNPDSARRMFPIMPLDELLTIWP